jgi:hypothetical protein
MKDKKSLAFRVKTRDGNGPLPEQIFAARSRDSLKASLKLSPHVAVESIECLRQVAFKVGCCDEGETVVFLAKINGAIVQSGPGDIDYDHPWDGNVAVASKLQQELNERNGGGG